MPTTYILLVVLTALIIYMGINYFRQRKASKMIGETEFREGFRKGQLIDLRDADDFKSGHILGARNIPLSQLKLYINGLRQDKPVYLYCQSTARSQRASILLHKAGFQEIYQLTGGFRKWTGKIKKT